MEQASASRPETSESASRSRRESLAGRRVLLVEDTPAQQRLMAALLARAGAEVVLECNGQAAVEEVFPRRGEGRRFDAVVMDLRMSPVDGAEAAGELRRRGFDAPILIVTVSDDPEDEARCRAAGCDRFLRKPVASDQLLDALEKGLSDRGDSPAARP
jgi:CheY-like chemotaxis protein